MGVLLQAWGSDISPYPHRFEPMLAEGGTRVIPPEGDFAEAGENLMSGRLLRANFATDPLSRFYATRSVGMDAGVSRDDAHVPFGGPGDLRMSVMFRYRFRGLVTGSLFSPAFVFCDATLQIYVEEFDSMSRFVRALIPSSLTVARMRSGVLEFASTENRAGTTVRTGVVPTVPGNFYRIWTDVQIAMTCHGAGLVRFEVGIPFVLAAFHLS